MGGELTAFLIGAALGAFFFRSKKENVRSKTFVCGHCESKDTLRINKIGSKEIFTCSFCEKVIDEDILRIKYSRDYEILKNYPEHYEDFKLARKEGRNYEVPRYKDNSDIRG